MQLAYLLMGHTGSHDDYATWPVAMYLDKELAETHCSVARTEAAALLAEVQHRNVYHLAQPTEFDPFFYAIEGSVGYSVREVPFMGVNGMTDMRNWFAVTNARPVRLNPTELSPEDQAKARAEFLAGLPRLTSSKKRK